MTNFHMVTPSEEGLRIVARAIEAITELVDWKKVADLKEADWTICLEVPQVVEALKQGAKVLHVGPGRSDYPLETLKRQYPGKYEYASSVGYEGRPAVVETIFRLAGFGAESRAIAEAAKEADSVTEPQDLQTLATSPCPVQGLRVMVVDDKEVNLKSALAQFGPKNEVQTFGRYEDLLKALNAPGAKSPDLLLSDMLMPVEEFCLGGKARSTHLGSDIPAGIFIAFAAARAGVPRIIIQTDAGHHDHPALALVDYLGWGREFTINTTKVSVVQASVHQGVKDWGRGFMRTDSSIEPRS